MSRRSLPYDGDIVFAEDFVVDAELSTEIEMTELYHLLGQLQRRLKSLCLTKEEFVLMKSIALVNSGNAIYTNRKVTGKRAPLFSPTLVKRLPISRHWF